MKRFAAIVLPELCCELARARQRLDGPFAVIVGEPREELDKTAVLDAVDAKAWRYGVRPGQSAVQACAYVSGLCIVHLSQSELYAALGTVAEIALSFGTTAALALELRGEAVAGAGSGVARYPMGAGAGPLDTVWLDVSGCSRLIGGEDVLCVEIAEKVRELGHRARVAIAGGPRIAQAVARWQVTGELLVPSAPAEAARVLGELPIAALPLERDTLSWFGKLGILRIDDLARLDRKRLAHRLKDRDILALIEGRDDVPLCAYEAPRSIVESMDLDHGVEGREPLLFVLRGLCARAVQRLSARGEACSRVTLTLAHDRGVVALENRNRLRGMFDDETHWSIVPPVALSREEELLRTLGAKLERLELSAPIVAVTLVLDELSARAHAQLAIGNKQKADPHALPTLLAELGAWLGSERVGVLQLRPSHRPEARSQLVPAVVSLPDKDIAALDRDHVFLPEPTRLLPQPIAIGPIARGALVTPEHATGLFIIDGLRASTRIDRVEWWTSSPVCRDYARAWLRCCLGAPSSLRAGGLGAPSSLRAGGLGAPSSLRAGGLAELAEAWVFVDRVTGQSFLHGWFD